MLHEPKIEVVKVMASLSLCMNLLFVSVLNRFFLYPLCELFARTDGILCLRRLLSDDSLCSHLVHENSREKPSSF